MGTTLGGDTLIEDIIHAFQFIYAMVVYGFLHHFIQMVKEYPIVCGTIFSIWLSYHTLRYELKKKKETH